ncbi:MAG: peptidyl-prolyl cis-trans isomerase [Gammaproteobacteria bacterium]
MIKYLIAALATFSLTLPFLLSPAQAESTDVITADQTASSAPPKDDVIAKVGDQPITFSQLNTMLNSSAIIGLSIPALGTPERDQTRLTLLDKVISSNLLYLDAVEQGMDKDPGYLQDLQDFSDGMLALVYKRRHAGARIAVSEKEAKAFFDDNMAPGTEWNDETRLAIEARLRKQKLTSGSRELREQLREGYKVTINVTELDPEDDAVRDDTEVVAEMNDQPIVWGEVKQRLSHPVAASSVERRISVLDDILDRRIMIAKARAEGLEQDPAYQRAFNEFSKVRLINRHRGQLVKRLEPSDDEIRTYYTENRARIAVPARRKVQIVVLKTQEEADAIKQMVEAGTITMFQAAQEHSIIPASDKTLGQIGWVSEGTGFKELDALTFSLGPGEIGGSVETPNGWHLVQVQDVEEAVYGDIEEERTWKFTRRMMIKERMNDYVVWLREESFPVEVYDDRLSYHMQKEVDWYKIKEETGALPPEKVYEEIDKLRGGRAPGINP